MTKRRHFVLWAEKGKGNYGHSEEGMTEEEARKVAEALKREYGNKKHVSVYSPDQKGEDEESED